MAKGKNNRINSDALLKKKALQSVKKPNPFEIQTGKTKFTVLNRDTHANRFGGLLGVRRAQAIEKRKDTLGREFLLKHKANHFVDQRKDGRNLGRDQIMSERKSMASRRKEMYNLNDTVKLTHRGQTLEEIERFDDAVDNDDSDEDGGQLDAEFMEAAHFGGGEDGKDREKDRKTVIEEMIAESKRRKAEKQRENDEVYEMTQKLDQNWQSLLSVVGGHMKHEIEPPKLEDYDKVMREMIFERRGKPADKLKSEEELAKVEREKLEKLERDRLARMKGEEIEAKPKHRSADDLDDGYLLQPVNDNEVAATDADVDAEDGLYNPRNISMEANEEKESHEGIEEEDSSGSESESGTDDGGDNYSDLKEDSESEAESPSQPQLQEVEHPKSSKPKTISRPSKDELERQKAREKAAAELPFTFEIPRKYEELADLFKQRSPAEQSIILERMFKSNNAKFSRENKLRMVSLFAFVIQHLNDCFSAVEANSIKTAFQTLDCLTPYLKDLTEMNSAETSLCFLEVLKEKQENFRKRPRQYPPLDTLIFLKLVPALFSASDFRHPVVSPSLVFVSEMLSRCQIRSRKDVTVGLFLVTTALECVEKSGRILPAALNFLNGVVYMCCPKRPIQIVPIVPPFKSFAPWNNLLALEDIASTCSESTLSLRADDFLTEQIDESFKLRVLHSTLGMVKNVCNQLTDTAGIHYISANFLKHIERLDEDLLPASTKLSLKETMTLVYSLHSRPLRYLVAPEQKPKPLRLLEPKIEPTYDEIRRRPKNQLVAAREQRKKLHQKVKRESRAAAREIRLDNEFIAKMQFKQRAATDRERREKVRRIFADATTQQGELKTLDRKAKYKK